jgi:hypothetical protein
MLFERLGLQRDFLPVQEAIYNLNIEIRLIEEKRDLPILKSSVVSHCHRIALDSYLLEDIALAREYARKMVELAKEEFFGSWRAEMVVAQGYANLKAVKQVEAWERDFGGAIFWASCLDAWEDMNCLAKYATNECSVGDYEPAEVGNWLLLLAAVLRDEPLQAVASHVQQVEKDRRKYYKFLLKLLRAILTNDNSAFNVELAAFLKYYKNDCFPKGAIDEKVTMDGTFMINFARHRGLDVSYSEEYSDHIVRLGEST